MVKDFFFMSIQRKLLDIINVENEWIFQHLCVLIKEPEPEEAGSYQDDENEGDESTRTRLSAPWVLDLFLMIYKIMYFWAYLFCYLKTPEDDAKVNELVKRFGDPQVRRLSS